MYYDGFHSIPFIPGQGASEEIYNLIMKALDSDKIKNEISRRIRIELDTSRNKYNGQVQSYESLTSGNVNMQARMAASGYDVYGKTIIGSNSHPNNANVYKKMKNKINYGTKGRYQNNGSQHVF